MACRIVCEPRRKYENYYEPKLPSICLHCSSKRMDQISTNEVQCQKCETIYILKNEVFNDNNKR